MALKGNRRHIKRLASSKYMRIGRKRAEYVAKPMPGRHGLSESIALSTIITEKLGYARDSREAKDAIKKGMIGVNGRTVREERYPLGFGDVIRIIPTAELYQITSGKGGSFKIERISEAKRSIKVVGKYIAKKGKTMIRLHDGRIVESINGAGVNDSVIIGEKGVEKVMRLESGKRCYVVKGTHASESGLIKEIKKGTALRDATVTIDGENGSFETLLKNIMVIED